MLPDNEFIYSSDDVGVHAYTVFNFRAISLRVFSTWVISGVFCLLDWLQMKMMEKVMSPGQTGLRLLVRELQITLILNLIYFLTCKRRLCIFLVQD